MILLLRQTLTGLPESIYKTIRYLNQIMSHIYREQTPLSQSGLYFAKNTPHDRAEFSLHYHDEFELTLVIGVNGKRIVGNVVDDFVKRDLVLVCPNALHDYTWNPEFTDADGNSVTSEVITLTVNSESAGGRVSIPTSGKKGYS